jgi:antitoxin HicB
MSAPLANPHRFTLPPLAELSFYARLPKAHDLPKKEGIFAEAQARAVQEVVAWQLAEAMKEKKISKNNMAALLKTSRTQPHRG